MKQNIILHGVMDNTNIRGGRVRRAFEMCGRHAIVCLIMCSPVSNVIQDELGKETVFKHT